MNNIIAISGKQRSGKDTLAAFLLTHLPGWRRVALADALKDEYCQAHGLDRAMIDTLKNQDPAIRGGLIAWGGMRRDEDPNYWVKQVIAQAPGIIVPDLRFQNEARAFQEAGALLVRVEANPQARANRGILSHEADPSETDLDGWKGWDWVIQNSSTLDQLERQALVIISRMKANETLQSG